MLMHVHVLAYVIVYLQDRVIHVHDVQACWMMRALTVLCVGFVWCVSEFVWCVSEFAWCVPEFAWCVPGLTLA